MQCNNCAGVGQLPRYGPCPACFGTGTPQAKYAGVGARATPGVILQTMSAIAMQLAMRGWGLWSGGAKGADKAFEQGCDMMRGRKVIRTATEWQPAMDHAARFHPSWDACKPAHRALHARNSLVMLGDGLDDPVRFVVCWTEGGAVAGGTGQALRIAAAYGVPVWNLGRRDPQSAMQDLLHGIDTGNV